jgi:HlyD family secretion protein
MTAGTRLRGWRMPWRVAGLLACCAAASADAGSAPLLLVGEVRAANAESIWVPPSMGPVVLRYYVPEGQRVEPGDVLVRIDPGQAASQIAQLEVQIEQADARADKEIAALDVAALDAEHAELDAALALTKARIDAAIPRSHVSALDADRFSGELERAAREHVLKQAERRNALEAVQRRRADAGLEVAKLAADLAYQRAQVANAEQRAETAGVVIHGFDRWRGVRYDEGVTANPGQKIGEVVGDGPMEVRAWVLESDRGTLREGEVVQLRFDALPGVHGAGRIERISGAPEPKAEWSDGRYFNVDIVIEEGASGALPLRPGMSVRVEAHPAAATPA